MFDRQLLEIEGSKKAMAICAAFAILRSICILGQALLLSWAICELWEGRALAEAAFAIFGFAACFIARQSLIYAQDSYIDKFSSNASARLQRCMIEKNYDAGPQLLRDKGTPAMVALLIDGSADIAQYFRIAYPKTIDCAIIPIALLVALFALDVISGIIALVCLPFIFIFMRLIGMTAKEEANARHIQFEKLSNSFVNIAQGIVDLKSFGSDGRFAKIIYDKSESFRRVIMKTLKVSMLSSAVLDLFSTLALAAVAIMLGFRMVDGDVSFFPALSVLVIVPEYFKPIREFGSNYHETLNGSESLSALNQMLKDDRCDLGPASNYWARSLTERREVPIDTKSHTITAITGPSGSGKTTFLNAIAGLSDPPDGFDFIVDGRRYSSLRDTDWRKRIAFVPQDPHIFSGTIRDNVRFYSPSASDDAVMKALKAVGMLDFVCGLPDALDTKIGEGGMGLSGGQLSRIALSRVLICDGRDILLLDEPSAHIDEATDAQIKQEIIPLLSDKTVFIATHDRSWEEIADEILPICDKPLPVHEEDDNAYLHREGQL